MHTCLKTYIHLYIHAFTYAIMHSLMHRYVNAYNEFKRVNVTMSIRAISVVYRKIGTIYLYNITL